MIEVIQPNFYCPLGLFFLCGCVLRRELRAASNFGFRIMGPEMGRLLGLLRWCETGIFSSRRNHFEHQQGIILRRRKIKSGLVFCPSVFFPEGFSALDKSRATFLIFFSFFVVQIRGLMSRIRHARVADDPFIFPYLD